MTKELLKVSSIYAILSIIFYVIVFSVHHNPSASASNVFAQILYAIGDVFFWINVNMYFILSLIISAAGGMLIAFFLKNKIYFSVFKYLFLIFTGLTALLLLIASLT